VGVIVFLFLVYFGVWWVFMGEDDISDSKGEVMCLRCGEVYDSCYNKVYRYKIEEDKRVYVYEVRCPICGLESSNNRNGGRCM